MGKRSIWIAEGILGVISGMALVMGYPEITMAGIVAIAATLDKLAD